MTNPQAAQALKPCPFCGAGTTEIRPQRPVWNGGLKPPSEPISVSIWHWCEPVEGQPNRGFERIGRDEASAIAAWNQRATQPAPQPEAQASPAPAPLSEEQAAAIFKQWRNGPLWLHMVRETERAHGIGSDVPVQATAVVDGALPKLLAHHAALLEHNSYAYFELAYTRSTGWMAWITDKPAKGEPGTAEYARSRKVIARGQGDTPEEAAADALSTITTQEGAQS